VQGITTREGRACVVAAVEPCHSGDLGSSSLKHALKQRSPTTLRGVAPLPPPPPPPRVQFAPAPAAAAASPGLEPPVEPSAHDLHVSPSASAASDPTLVSGGDLPAAAVNAHLPRFMDPSTLRTYIDPVHPYP
jgi:hypothetical protein